MENIKEVWGSLNPKVKYCIKSFFEKMAIMLDVTFILVGFIKFMCVAMSGGHWLVTFLWLLFMLIFIAIAWIYIEIYINKPTMD